MKNKTQNKTLMKRLLALEVCLAILGIIISSSVYLYALGQQQRIAENLFQHPFAVSNAGVEFRSDVLELRRYMLEVMAPRTHLGDTELASIRRLEEKMDRQIAIIRREYLGDHTLVNNIILEMDAWKKNRESIKAQLLANKPDAA
jgi:hypothetical protein